MAASLATNLRPAPGRSCFVPRDRRPAPRGSARGPLADTSRAVARAPRWSRSGPRRVPPSEAGGASSGARGALRQRL